MTEEVATEEVEVAAGDVDAQLENARKGLRTCLACRTAFPNRLAVVKHQMQGCRKQRK